MPSKERVATVHAIAELWRTVTLDGNKDFHGVLDISVTNGSVSIHIGFSSDCFRERREDVSARRLLWWHTQLRIFRKLNRRAARVCDRIRSTRISLPDPKNPLRLIEPGRKGATSE
ncbi:hypothetical protein [Kutzneria chonburiensis]|uniref:Uncharacterized protein n=1 Tax=Kutzneria chonburiensis TaxID=1483604 RepID=A0ABV6N4T8_9PSEU|nr:hypothetical protein [Kutzneria chonburiensis]